MTPRRRVMPRVLRAALVLLSACATTTPAPARTTTPAPPPTRADGVYQRGIASWVGKEGIGYPLKSGERFDYHQLTAAHRSLPMGSLVRVTNTHNGRSVVVRINDVGPFGGRGRIIDVTKAAAEQLGFIDAGTAPVTLEVIRRGPR
jgi:peptidoglycan lytic transglycosylase